MNRPKTTSNNINGKTNEEQKNENRSKESQHHTYVVKAMVHQPIYSENSYKGPVAPELPTQLFQNANGYQAKKTFDCQNQQVFTIDDSEDEYLTMTSSNNSMQQLTRKKLDSAKKGNFWKQCFLLFCLALTVAIILAGIALAFFFTTGEFSKEYDGQIIGYQMNEAQFCIKYKNVGTKDAYFSYSVYSNDNLVGEAQESNIFLSGSQDLSCQVTVSSDQHLYSQFKVVLGVASSLGGNQMHVDTKYFGISPPSIHPLGVQQQDHKPLEHSMKQSDAQSQEHKPQGRITSSKYKRYTGQICVSLENNGPQTQDFYLIIRNQHGMLLDRLQLSLAKLKMHVRKRSCWVKAGLICSTLSCIQLQLISFWIPRAKKCDLQLSKSKQQKKEKRDFVVCK